MKKILIISYTFSPCNQVSAFRTNSFAKYFSEFDLFPIIVTRHWTGNERTLHDYRTENIDPIKIDSKENFTAIYLPYKTPKTKRYKNYYLYARLKNYSQTTLGKYELDTEYFSNFYKYIYAYLKNNKIDYIMVTTPPLGAVRFGYELSKMFNIPLIVDFRDLWTTEAHLQDQAYESLGIKMKAVNFFRKVYLSKWLKKAKLIVSVSQPAVDEIKKLVPNVKTALIFNGFEDKLFDNYQVESSEKFTFSSIGTIYPEQDLSVMIEGMKIFLADKDLSRIQLNFIGIAVQSEVPSKIQSNLPAVCTRITDRVPRHEAVKYTLESQVLFYPAWRGYKGILSGKIFEYLASKRNILVAPSDNDVVEKIINETGAGKVADSPQEFAHALNYWYSQWILKNDIEYNGKEEKIEFYTRKNQAKLLVSQIQNL